MRGKQTLSRLRARNAQLWRSPGNRAIRTAIVIAAVFFVGVNFGNGRFSLPSQGAVGTNLPASLDYTTVNELYRSLKDNYDGNLTEAQLVNGLKHGLADATKDPYTVYFTPQEASSFNDERQGIFSGIGAELGKDGQGNIQVIAPISGTPAERAGIKSKDIIATINGKSTSGLSVDAAVKQIRGKAGTTVTLQLLRVGASEPLELKITRQTITTPSVTSKTLDNNLGYIRISSFSDDTTNLMNQAAADLKGKGVRGIVLDLRNNPGGNVDASIAVSSQWLPINSTVMQEKRGNVVLDTYRSSGTSLLSGVPTAILVNGGSASASEIVAAALKDNKQGYIIGEKTYGKGVVQKLVSLNDGGQLKVTIASWYRPNGQNINQKGIQPDQTVKPAEADAPGGSDAQLQAAQDYLNKR